MNVVFKRACKWVVFSLIGILLFRLTDLVFLEKNSYAKYRSYKAEDKVDVLVLGSSHPNGGINAGQLETMLNEGEGGGRTEVFNYSIYGMRIEQMYFFMREILKEKTPDLIILDTFSFVPVAEGDREILARRALDVFPLSQNKIEAMKYLILEDRWSYYLPIIKYHTRWKELSEYDLNVMTEKSLWEMAGKGDNQSTEAMEKIDDYFETDTTQMNEMEEINETERECLEGVLSIAEEKGIDILLVTVPFKQQLGMDSMRMIRVNNYLRDQYVDGDHVRMLDLNRKWDELEFGYADLANEGHCNGSGARKVTEYIGDYLLETYDTAEWGR